MINKYVSIAVSGVAVVAMAGCVATPPRAQYSDAYYQRRAEYGCMPCGVIRDVGQVYVGENATSGGGAVLGAIIGGVLGNTLGHGRGRTATTVAGAVAGGFAGNAIEGNSNQAAGDRPAWQFNIRLDDGRWAKVTQWNNDDLRPGDRVMIRDNHLIRVR